MKLFFYSIFVFFILNIQIGFSQNAPVSTIGEVVSNESTIMIPITATGFNNIGSCNLQILYDPAIVTCTSVNQGSGMVGGIATNLTVPGVITLGWYTWPGITMPDNSIMFELNFSRVSNGYSEITWDVDCFDRQWSNGEFVQLTDTPFEDYYINGSVGETTEVGITVFLEGPFNGIDMDSSISLGLPLSQPYNTAPWNYNGPESVASIPNPNVVDWVFVEFRDAVDVASATSTTTIEQQAAFLLRDGSIVGMDGTSNLQLNNAITQQLFVVIRHRNHIGIISASPLINAGGLYSFDLTTSIDKVYGGAAGYKDIASGVYGMAGGNGNADGSIDTTDSNGTWKPQAGTNGYLMGDYSLDSEVNNIDKNDIWVPNIGLESQIPE